MEQIMNGNISELLIISHTGTCWMIWKIVIIICIIISSFIYAAFSAFRHNNFTRYQQNGFEFVFLFDLLLHFNVDFPSSHKTAAYPIREYVAIANNYIHGSLVVDLIPLLPFQLLRMERNRQHLFFAIKIMRVFKAFKYMNVSKLMHYLQETYIRYVQANIATWTEGMTYEEVKCIDYNKIFEFLFLGYCLKTLRMFMVIVSLSYFSAMIFKIIIEVEEDLFGHIAMTECDDAGGFFKACYNLWEQSTYEVILKLVYFIFTTLSTVGFGDFSPKSNIERIVVAFGMLLGVAIFSLIMGEFIEMLESVKELQADHEDGEALAKFFGVLITFNRG